MPQPITVLGACHTLISFVPFGAGLYSFIRYRHIDSTRPSGHLYLIGLTVAVFTSFGLSSTGGFNIGHALGILALLAVITVLFVIPRLSFLGQTRPYLSLLGLNFSFFLLLVPGINETLTRLPVSHPLADGPMSPWVRGVLAGWLALFALGSAIQLWWFHAKRNRARYVALD